MDWERMTLADLISLLVWVQRHGGKGNENRRGEEQNQAGGHAFGPGDTNRTESYRKGGSPHQGTTGAGGQPG